MKFITWHDEPMTSPLSSADLNLFVVFQAVLEEGSATRAAKRLHVTQSAVSGSLKRLRELLGDPLFVRRGLGLTPTPVAAELGARVGGALEVLSQVVQRGRPLDPATTERHFTFACADDQELSGVPRIFQVLRARMPRASLSVVTPYQAVVSDGLASGTVDAALAPDRVKHPGLRTEVLYEESQVLVVRVGHPRVRKRTITRALFEALPQIEVSVLGPDGVGKRMDDDGLSAHGLSRDVALTVPHFMAAAMIASETDLVATLPRRFAERVSSFLPLRVVAGPVRPAPRASFALVWHARTDEDPASQLFRSVVREALGGSRARR